MENDYALLTADLKDFEGLAGLRVSGNLGTETWGQETWGRNLGTDGNLETWGQKPGNLGKPGETNLGTETWGQTGRSRVLKKP
jgi:hypothetical protein